MSRVLAIAVLAAGCAAGCNRAITLEVASDRPVPQAIDSICVGVADRAASGGQFGRAYALTGAQATLPQTLRVEPGGADTAWAWVRGDLGGVAVASAGAGVDFAHDLTLALDRCNAGSSAAPAVVGAAAGPGAARVVGSQGPDGNVVVAVANGSAAVLDAVDGALVAVDAPAPPAGNIVAVIAADLDGDCDDDIVIATDAAPPEWWRRDHATFVDVGPIGSAPVAALAAADVDHDGDVDLVLGGGATLALWRNDGAGNFAHDTSALAGAGLVTAISAVALGDLDGDGHPDLVVGQADGPLAAWFGDPGGTGSFLPAPAAVPAVPLAVARLALVDADGDDDPDLVVAVTGAPMRLYIDRGGVLEDQSFVRLPQPAPVAAAIAIGGWDGGCEPDAVIAAAAGASTLAGTADGTFVADGTAPAASDVVMVDLDDDGVLDALLAGSDGVTWLAR